MGEDPLLLLGTRQPTGLAGSGPKQFQSSRAEGSKALRKRRATARARDSAVTYAQSEAATLELANGREGDGWELWDGRMAGVSSAEQRRCKCTIVGCMAKLQLQGSTKRVERLGGW